MISQLYEALVAHYANSPLPELAEGLFLYRAPQGTSGNYITMRLISGRPRDSFTDRLEDCVIQFSIWSADSSPRAALAIADILEEWLEDVAITVPGGTMVRATRQTTPLLLPDPDGGWQVAVDYSFWVQEA